MTTNPHKEEADETIAFIAASKHKPGALLPILHGIQERLGFIPADSVAVIAKELNLSRAEVHGVVSFYHYFRCSPPGRHVVRICRAEACQSMGADALISHVKSTLGIDLGETTTNGEVTCEAIYCLGNCACSPALLLDGCLHGRVTAEKFDHLLSVAKKHP